MFRKSVLKAAALAAVSATVFAIGASSSSAGGYGNSYNRTHNSPSNFIVGTTPRPYAHIQDHIWQQHVEWCYNRFRTYNEYNNTYQPYTGPRQQCWSPYISG